MSDPPPSPDHRPKPCLGEDARNVLRGLCMGTADVVPGVSGGTVALILGIYQRLVTAISHIDRHTLASLFSGNWRKAADRIDLRFLVALGSGIALGIVLLGRLMNQLLLGESSRAPTLAAFCGMVLASTWLVARYVQVRGSYQVSMAVGLAALGVYWAYLMTGLPFVHQELTPPYLFLCGMVGICAMILPGISGAYILLILGVYLELTGILKALPRVSGHDALLVLAFACGCGLGLISFSKILRWLLTHYQWQTMAVLCGFMLGALRRIWPFQEIAPGQEAIDEKHRIYENIWPEAFTSQVWWCIIAATLAAVLILAIDRATLGHQRRQPGAE